MAMPIQRLHGPRPAVARRPRRLPGIALRRAAVILPAIALTGFAAREMWRVLSVGGVTPAIGALLALFVALFAWIALSFTSAAAGFVS